MKLAPVPAYTEYWASPLKKDPARISQEEKQAFVQKVVDAALQEQGRHAASTRRCGINNEWKYFASSEGSYIEQETFEITPSFNVSAKVGDVVKTRNFVGVPKTGGWEVAEEAEMLESAERIAAEAVEMTTAKPIGMGLKDLVLTPAHAMLTIHEIVAHATELDRILGYEANYAGTSFVKLSDVGKLKYGSKLMNITADRTMPGGMATIGFDDDGVKTTRVPDRPRRHSGRPADQPRDGAAHRRQGEQGLHVGVVVARLPVPADAERPRSRPGRRDRRTSSR